MANYTSRTPVTNLDTDAQGATHMEVADIGRNHHIGRLPAFAGLAKFGGGYYVEAGDKPLTVNEALHAADLDFTMQFEEQHSNVITDTGVVRVTYPQRGVVAAYGPNTVGGERYVGMASVGGTYQFVQNDQAAKLGQAIIDEGGANVAAMGAYGTPRGSKTYMAFKLPDCLTVAGQDPHDLYLTVLNSHNGKGALNALFAPIRQACTNMTTANFGKGVSTRFKLTHSGDVDYKVDDAREALEIAFKWTEQWEITADKLLHTPITAGQLEKMLHRILPTPTGAGKIGEGNWSRRRIELRQIITQSRTNEFGRGTAYAVYNGVVEQDNHFHNFNVGRDETREEAKARDFARVLDGDGEKRALETLDMLLALA